MYRFTVLAIFLIWFPSFYAWGGEPTYDPLRVSTGWKANTLDLAIKDVKRNREIPVRIYLPESSMPSPVILFSHGLGGSREGNPYLGHHWAGRGYLVVFLQHPGSDESVWKDVSIGQRMTSMKGAANLQNTLLRFKDVSVVIDELEKWNISNDSKLKGRLDLNRLGMSGHSFGAVTTQGVSGQSTGRGFTTFTDKRIKASVIMSPSGPMNGGDPKKAFANVSIPWLLMTGTKDESIIGGADVSSRLSVFPGLPPGNKYELVLDGGEHEAFSDRTLPSREKNRNPNHHRLILGLSTAFWDAYLREDAQAKSWLDGNGPSTILEKKDRWQKK